MHTKRLLHTAFIIWFTASLLPFSIKAAATADSIRMEMESKSGEDLLWAHYDLCRLVAAGDDADSELATIRGYIKEAGRQSDLKAGGLDRGMLIDCYYNYGMSDSLKLALPENLAFMAEHGLWDRYYNSWNVLVELYMYNDKLQTALNEAEKMYADAKENESNYGLGVSAYCVGSIYQTMQRFDEAAESLRESTQILSSEEDITLLLSAYNALGETLDALGEYEELRRITIDWKAALDKYKREAEAKGRTPALNGRYLYCTLAATVPEIETGHYEKAAQLLAQAEEFAEGRKQIARSKLLQIKARYYAATGQYDKAILYNRENIEILASAGNFVSMLTVELQQAEFLLAAGQYKESAELYKQAILHKDELRNSELSTQLDELRTLFEVDKLTLKNKIATNRLYFLLAISALLLVFVILYILYTRRLRSKNRLLFDAVTQLQKIQNNLYVCKERVLEEDLSNEEILFNNLNKLMVDEQLFKDQQIKRDYVATKLNTNRTYLAESIKKCADGITFTEYLNQHRLHYAANLLTNNFDLNINEAGDESGFNSRSTYNRLFRDCYGMSPSEFRDIAREKKLG